MTTPEPFEMPPTPRRRRRWLGNLVAVLAVGVVIAFAWALVEKPFGLFETGSPSGAGFGGPPGSRPGPGASPPAGASGGQQPARPPGEATAAAAGTPAPPAGGTGGPMGGAFGRGGQTTVGVAPVAIRDVPVTLESLGTVTPAAMVTVTPQVGGMLTEIRFTEGEVVQKGEVLAVIDPRPFEIALMEAEGQLARDQAQLENARVTLQRYQTLMDQDSIARQDVDTQAATVRQLQGTVTADKAAVASAQLNLDYTRIKAPVTGRVGLRVIDAGNYIAAGAATGVAVITQVDPIDVEFTVPQDLVPEIEARVRGGTPLGATALDRTRTRVLAEGTFSTLDNQVNTTTGTVRAKARFANGDGRLFPSQFVNLRLVINTYEQALVVPSAAVRQSSRGPFVWLLAENQTVTQRAVETAVEADGMTVVTSGLQAGDTVVTEGLDRLTEGARVTVPGAAPPAAAGEQPRRRNRDGGGQPAAAATPN
ncbi:MdtA/MuxA family multidrug efflux RND transporter periplasmic adaptor subunit [Zavarzinia sp. CC-PAN008]|uniref:MdtA/MuxA family multidrug efflux RND transporter periplasmic adaptor subunit n=1 Tax=Zavarzinia sp. CC-PAN008 TaxID=3243332 RepID=UPI003F749A24